MIRRVLSQPRLRLQNNGGNLQPAALPPGTPVTSPVQRVIIFPAQSMIGTTPADALVTSDGRPVYATGPAQWGQVVAAGVRG